MLPENSEGFETLTLKLSSLTGKSSPPPRGLRKASTWPILGFPGMEV